MRGFYWYLRPIFLVSKLFGVLPLQNVHCADGFKIQFRYLSLAHLYSTIIFFSVLTAFIYTSNLIFFTMNYPNKSTEVYTWNLIVVYVITARSSLCFLFCVHYSKKLPNLIRKLEIYEKKKYQLIKKKHFVKELFMRSIFPFINGSFYAVASYFEMQAFIMRILDSTIKDSYQAQKAAMIFGILSDWQIAPLLLYCYFARTITINFTSINTELSSHCNFEKIEPQTGENHVRLLEILKKARSLHTLMSSAVIETSHCYGSFMAIDQVCIIIMFVVNLYVFVFVSYDNYHLLICTLINGVLILGVILLSHEIKVSALSITEVLKHLSLLHQDPKIQAEVQLFMTQLACRPIAVSAAGYFIMDRGQISSIFSSVATYFIVIIQFKLRLSNRERSSAKSDI